MDTKWK